MSSYKGGGKNPLKTPHPNPQKSKVISWLQIQSQQDLITWNERVEIIVNWPVRHIECKWSSFKVKVPGIFYVMNCRTNVYTWLSTKFQDPVTNENAGFFCPEGLRISKQQQQSIKPGTEPSWVWGPVHMPRLCNLEANSASEVLWSIKEQRPAWNTDPSAE